MRDLGTRDLGELREGIDYWDDRLVRDLAERLKLSDEAGLLKFRKGEPLHDPERERAIVEGLTGYAMERGLDDGLVGELYEVILRYSKRSQKRRVSEETME